MKSLGDYMELDLRQGRHYHDDAIKLNTGRCCLQYIVKAKQYKKIYVPYYTCCTVTDSLKACNVEYEFYSINESLEPVKEYKLKSDEAFLYTNYYGLTHAAVVKLLNIYGAKLIVDNTMAFYEKPLQGIDTFYSARKFFGVSDGAYLYTDTQLKEDLEQDFSFDRMIHLLKRIDISIEEAHIDFVANEKKLQNQPIKKMSKLTERILMGIDYEAIKNRRIENYLYLDSALKNENLLKINYPNGAVPLLYPFFSYENHLRERLIENKIYVGVYFPNIYEWCTEDQLEYKLTKYVMTLPVNQRHDVEDMAQIVKLIIKN